MKQILLMIAVVALVGCGKKPAEESVFDQGRPDITKPSKPPAKTEAQIEAETKAFAETKAKAEEGDSKAQGLLAWEYTYGEKKDPALAFEWSKKAAAQSDSKGEFILGRSFSLGQGVKQDFKEAVKWYQKAADQGIAEAQNNLGVMYGMGNGVEQNFVTAYAWASIAATNGNKTTPRFKSQFLEPKMTPAQIAEAGELVKEMVEKNPKLLNKK